MLGSTPPPPRGMATKEGGVGEMGFRAIPPPPPQSTFLPAQSNLLQTQI